MRLRHRQYVQTQLLRSGAQDAQLPTSIPGLEKASAVHMLF